MTAKYGFTSHVKRADVKPTAVRVLNDTGVRVFNESQRETPVDTGNLKASGRLEAATTASLRTEITYGGTAAQYAAPVHELHRTNAKYLERPARQNADRFRRDLQRALKSSMQ